MTRTKIAYKRQDEVIFPEDRENDEPLVYRVIDPVGASRVAGEMLLRCGTFGTELFASPEEVIPYSEWFRYGEGDDDIEFPEPEGVNRLIELLDVGGKFELIKCLASLGEEADSGEASIDDLDCSKPTSPVWTILEILDEDPDFDQADAAQLIATVALSISNSLM